MVYFVSARLDPDGPSQPLACGSLSGPAAKMLIYQWLDGLGHSLDQLRVHDRDGRHYRVVPIGWWDIGLSPRSTP